MKRPMCIGHRGAKGHLPENTLPSFDLALEQGADWIELDVYVLDDELVVIHDDEVDRTTNGRGQLSDYTFETLRQLDAGNGAPVPTLQEVIDLLDGRCGLNVELKGPGTAAPVCSLLEQAIIAGWQRDQFLLSSFDHEELALADPAFKRGALFGRLPRDPFAKAEALGAWSVNFSVRTLSPDLVKEAHERDYRVLVYTVNEEADLRRVLEMGVDGIFSDYPDRLRAAIDEMGQ